MLSNEELVQRLVKLEDETRLMEPRGDELEDLTSKIVDYTHGYLNNIGNINAYDGSTAIGQNLAAKPFGEEGQNQSALTSAVQL